MNPIDHIKLVKRLECVRHIEGEFKGRILPESISILLSMLEVEGEPGERYDIYQHIILECQILHNSSLECEYSKNRYAEFNDSTSLIAYSHALIGNGEFEYGIAMAKSALEMSIAEGAFINDTAVSYVRESLRTRSVAYINESLRLFLATLDASRTEDCKLELDWIDSALRFGADPALIDEIRVRGRG